MSPLEIYLVVLGMAFAAACVFAGYAGLDDADEFLVCILFVLALWPVAVGLTVLIGPFVLLFHAGRWLSEARERRQRAALQQQEGSR